MSKPVSFCQSCNSILKAKSGTWVCVDCDWTINDYDKYKNKDEFRVYEELKNECNDCSSNLFGLHFSSTIISAYCSSCNERYIIKFN